MISSKKLDELDFVLASFYEDELSFHERQFVESLVFIYSLFRDCYLNSGKVNAMPIPHNH